MIIASLNFRDEEFKVPKDIFEKNGYSITVVSGSLSLSVGMLGMKVRPDITLDKVKVDDFDAVVFIGGSGSAEYFTNELAHKIAKDAVAKGKTLGAICLAPVILANAGLLKGKKATCNDPESIIKKGADYTGRSVEQDGKIITGIGPEAAKEFAETILRSCKNP